MDIVERLREQPTMSVFANMADMVGRLNHERGEAADEIERLRAALKDISNPDWWGGDTRRNDLANRMIRRSRAALVEKQDG